MATALTYENPTDWSAREGNDLTVIRGIGLARQRWLSESFNVRTFRDLAALSAEEIESRLKAEGQIASRSEIEQWIARAQELAAAAGEGDWKPFASFVVEFQAREVEGRAEERRTAIHYMEADKSETWPGIESDQLCQWMLDQVGEKVQREPEEGPPVEARPATVPSVTVEITQIQAFQPPQNETPSAIGQAGRPFQGFVRSSEPFALKASFVLTGLAAPDTTKRQITYSAQFHAYNLSTGERTHMGDTSPDTLAEGESSYKAVLPEATLQPGVYRLWVLATLQGAPPTVGYLEVPMLQVV